MKHKLITSVVVIVIACLAIRLGIAQPSVPVQGTRALTIPGVSAAGIAFLENGALVLTSCSTPETCRLIKLTISSGELLMGESADVTVSLRSPSIGSNVHSIGVNRFLLGKSILTDPELRLEFSLRSWPAGISEDGTLVGFTTSEHWCVAMLDAKQECLFEGDGKLLAFSTRTAVVDTKDGVVLRPLNRTEREVKIVSKKCADSARTIGADIFAVSSCGKVLILSSKGVTARTLDALVLGYDY